MDLRPIPGQPGYLCGADGSVWSVKRGVLKRMRAFLRGRRGYLGVNLTRNGKYRMHSVHTLVATIWIGSRPTPAHGVMHKDDDPANNAAVNLAWGLPVENSAQMVARGRQARGERIGISKLTRASVAVIRKRIARGDKQKDVAEAFDVSASNVSDIKLGRIWRAD